MVGPSITDETRRVASRRLKVGFVCLVGLSGGLVALAGNASTVGALAAVGVGLLVGLALVAYLSRVGQEWRRTR
ncbi:MAG: hypothetical protein ABEI80_07580 [Haloplanus sp.]